MFFRNADQIVADIGCIDRCLRWFSGKNAGQYGLSALTTLLRFSTFRKYESSTTEKLVPQENTHGLMEITPFTKVSLWGLMNWWCAPARGYEVTIWTSCI